jgi:predicted NBD/HSP70 family sugar kinase
MSGTSVSPQRSFTVPDTANSLMQNRINISIIFNYLRAHGVAYRAQIARDLGISAPAVSRAIEKLLKDEYVIESEKVTVENGKKAAQVSVNAERGYIVGVDLLAEPIMIAISDFGGTLQDTYLAPAIDRTSDFSDYLIASIVSGLRAFEGKSAKGCAHILAIGIGVPAVVDPRTGSILSASLYEGIAKSNIHARVSGYFKIPVFIENISNLAAIGEWKRGVGRNARNLLFIEIGNGIGAGIILDGDLYRGAQGAAGEIGYFITESAGLGYDSSKSGYLESRASLAAFRLSGATPAEAPDSRYQSVTALLDAARAGASDAVGFIRDATRHLAAATINIMLLLNPEMVIIGGAICELPDIDVLILNPLIEEVIRNYPFTPASIRLASLGAKASLIGALQFALDSLVVHTYPYRL